MRERQQNESASTATALPQTTIGMYDDHFAQLPPLLDFDQNGVGIWADGFRFDTDPEQQDPSHYLTSFDDITWPSI